MYIFTVCCNGKRCFIRHRFFPFLIMLILLLPSCKNTTEPYSILEFTGKGEIYNYSRSLFPIVYGSDSINSTALLAGRGDIIVYGNNSCFYYRESSQKIFSIKTTDNIGFVNGKINSINIPIDDEMIPWFKQMTSEDLSKLEFLYFNSPIVESYIPYLTKLAEIKPDIGLGYEGDLNELYRILEIFKPKFIIGVNVPRKDFNLLSGLTNLEFLSASLNDSIYTIPVPAMPKLKHLILANIQKNDIKNDDFLINNRQLEKLTILEADNFDLLLIEPLKSLKELIINGTDTIENFDLIKNHKEIELLSVTGEKLNNDLAINELPEIRWLSIYEDVTQEGFSALIKSHPDLEVVEIINNDTINNLQPLLNLRKLYGLTVTDTITDLGTVKSLKNLKYLSIPDNVFNDSIIKAELLKSLPDTRIVANQGVCLGSGWLLLIIPIILILRVFTNRKSQKIQDTL